MGTLGLNKKVQSIAAKCWLKWLKEGKQTIQIKNHFVLLAEGL